MKGFAIFVFTLVGMFSINACGGNSGEIPGEDNNTNTQNSVNIEVERGPVYGAYVSDSAGSVATQEEGKNIYTFSSMPSYPIKVTGGWIDLNGNQNKDDDDIVLDVNLSSYGTTVTPLTTLLAESVYSDELRNKLKERLSEDFNISISDLILPPSKSHKNVAVLNNAVYVETKKNHGTLNERFSYNDGNIKIDNRLKKTYREFYDYSKNDKFKSENKFDALKFEQYIVKHYKSLFETIYEFKGGISYKFFSNCDIFAKVDSNLLYLKNEKGIYKSNNNGKTWNIVGNEELNNFSSLNKIEDVKTKIYDDDQFNSSIEDIAISDSGDVYVSVYDFAVYKYVSGTLERLGGDFNSTPGTLYFDQKSKILYSGTFWNGVYKYTNGNWIHFSEGLPSNYGVSSIASTPNGNLYALLIDQSKVGGIYKYDSGVKKWKNYTKNLSLGLLSNATKIVSNKQNEIFIQIHGRGLFKTNDQSSVWEDVNEKKDFYPIDSYKTVIKENHIFSLVGNESPFGHTLLYHSSDSGKTWTEFSKGIHENKGAQIMDYVLKGNFIYVCTYDYKLLKKSLDNNSPWINLYTFHSSPNAIVIDKDNNIFVSTFWDGIMKSDDGGETFKDLHVPFSQGGYEVEMYIKDGSIYIEKNGEAYMSDDGGNTWKTTE